MSMDCSVLRIIVSNAGLPYPVTAVHSAHATLQSVRVGTTLLHPQRRRRPSGVRFWRNRAPRYPREELAHHCERRDEVLGCLIGLVTHHSLQLPLASVLLHRKFLIVLPLPARSACYLAFTPV